MLERLISSTHGCLSFIECTEPQWAGEARSNVDHASRTTYSVFSPPSAHIYLVVWELSVSKTSAYLTSLVSCLLRRMERAGTPHLPAAPVDASDRAYLPKAQKAVG